MRTAGPCATLAARFERGGGRVELRIVIEDLDPPSGRAAVDGHDAWTFVGWLELIESVERLKDEDLSSGWGD
jgi:hypothetical protein